MVRQPLDECLAAVVLLLRRLSIATMFRIDSYVPLDASTLTNATAPSFAMPWPPRRKRATC